MSGTLLSQGLRFTRSDGTAFPDWDEKRLGEVAKRCKAKNSDLEYMRVLTNSAVYGVVDQADYFDKDIANAENLGGYSVVKRGDFVYNPRVSISAPVGPIKRNDLGDGVMSPLYSVFRFHNDDTTYFAKYFQTSHWHRYMKAVANYGARHDRMAISTSDFMALPLPIPHPDEQQKIAEFLSVVDAKIVGLKARQEGLERYKRGLMQALFSQRLRFTKPDGTAFPDWEEKRLGDIVLSIESGMTLDQNAEGLGIRVTRIETISNAEINLERVGYVQTADDVSRYLLEKGDILFSNINSVKHIGKCALVGEVGNLYHGMNLLRIRPKNSNAASGFLFAYLTSVSMKRHFERVCNQAVSQASINQTELGQTKVSLPHPDEQQKNADALQAMDAKIAAVAGHMAQMEEFKKGLLQQMFV